MHLTAILLRKYRKFAPQKPNTGAVLIKFAEQREVTAVDQQRRVGRLKGSRPKNQVAWRPRRAARKAQPTRNDPSLNHLVRAQEQRLQDRDSECLGGLQVDPRIRTWLAARPAVSTPSHPRESGKRPDPSAAARDLR
jgi:hypothetical protein